MAKRSVVVHIAGQRYVVRSGAEEGYVKTLATFVDERIQEIQQASKRSSQSLAVLAALNIADDLFQERQKRAELKRIVSQKSRAMLNCLDKEVISRLQEQK